MKGALSATFLISAFVAEQVVATGFGSWGGAPQFPTPQNCDNKCDSDKQKKGYNWDDLPLGKFDSYDDFGFSGFTCANGLDKRSLSVRTGHGGGGKGSDKTAQGPSGDNGKCIKAPVSKTSKDSCSFSQKKQEKFSINTIHVSTSYNTDVDCHYKMPDNSTCTHTISCGQNAQPFENKQCGGATEVSFQIPDHGEDKGCEIGIHSIDFDCSPPATTNKPTSSPTLSPSTATSVSIPLTTGISSPPSSPSETPSGPPVSPPGGNSTYTMPAGPSGSTSTPPVSVPMTVSTIYTTITSTTVQCAETVKNCPAESTSTYTSTSVVGVTTCPVSQGTGTSQAPTATPPVVTPPATPSTPTIPTPSPSGSVVTVTTYTTETTCPVTNTITTGGSTTTSIGSTVSTTVITTTITTCTACAGGQPSISTGVSSQPSGSPPAPAPCPSLLPSCLNTFIPYLTSCLSNSDHSCFCPDQKLTGSVMDCIKSWGASQDDISAAYSFFAGICAAAVPSNPGIVTAVPPSITLTVPSVAPTSPAAASPPAAGTAAPPAGSPPPPAAPLPATTISYTQTVTTGGQTTTVTSAATVPQVSFTTNTPAAPTGGVPAAGTTTQNVGLVPAGTPTGAAGAGAGASQPGASSPLSPTSGAGSNGTTQASPSPSAFLGAARRVSTGSSGLVIAVLAGMAALLL